MTPSSNTSTSMVGLVGVDDGDDVAAVHGVAGLDAPFEQRADVHVGAERGHQEVAHLMPLQAPSSLAAATMSGTCGSAASSRCLA